MKEGQGWVGGRGNGRMDRRIKTVRLKDWLNLNQSIFKNLEAMKRRNQSL